jgi:hypothetical protein
LIFTFGLRYIEAIKDQEEMAYERKKIDDHYWVVEYSEGGNPITECFLLDAGMNRMAPLPFDGSRVDVDLVEHGDGMYMVQIRRQSGAVAYVVIADFSDAYSCYKALFRFILCRCDDPCQECDEDMRSRMYDMNSIMALVETLREMVLLEQAQYAGIYSMGSARRNMVDEMGAMFDKLHIITDRCGLCSGDETNCIDC